ncbi:MAG: Crp/Fnr family transcriptional regulator [Candidatus Atribacteria bacterium]|jgi:CRP/FNR family cyclic AMP-dependent transcriptional regulator|nr:Crp/Fnr family transcriptional regulator [Thermoplasmata archaeon]TFH09030.1 MAG: Crp/Fnr family transcriptional regulator [Candidatus Atribacteria bacterium]
MFSTTTNNKISFTELLAECGDLLELDRGETIYHPGTPSTIIYLVETGRVKLAYLDESGKKLTLRIVDEGEIFGEMCLVGEAYRRHLATSIEDTIVRSIDKKKFLKIIEANDTALPMLVNHFAARMTEFEETLEDLAFRDIQARLSRQLLKLSDDYGVETKEGILIGISVTHKELADMIGSARENTTLALNRFAKEGILDKSRYRIIIKSEDGLRKKISAF